MLEVEDSHCNATMFVEFPDVIELMCIHQVMDIHLGSLESIQDARVAHGS